MVAMAQKGLGRVYMEQGKTGKALRHLHKADEYFSSHDKEELTFTKENFEYMSAALLTQRKQMIFIALGAVLILSLLLIVLLIGKKLRRSRKEQAEVSAVLEETIQETRRPILDEDIPHLSAREKEILDLLTKGYTTPQIAEGLGLSPETIKWYRKKLLVKFDVAHTAELTSTAKDLGLI